MKLVAYPQAYWHKSGRKIERLTDYELTVVLPGGIELTVSIGDEEHDPTSPTWSWSYFYTTRDQRIERNQTRLEFWPSMLIETAFGEDMDPLAASVAAAQLQEDIKSVLSEVIICSHLFGDTYGELRRGEDWEPAILNAFHKVFTLGDPALREWER